MKGFWWMGEERSVGVCVLEDGGVCSGCACVSPRAPPSSAARKHIYIYTYIYIYRIGQVTPGAWKVGAAAVLLRRDPR
jgi:hypothetical protein